MSVARVLRIAARQILIDADTLAGPHVFLPRDWPTNKHLMPAILLQTPREESTDLTNGVGIPQFWTTTWLELQCQVTDGDPGKVEEDAEFLGDQARLAMMRLIIGPPQTFRRITQIRREFEITSEGQKHIGEARLTIGFEYFEAFAPEENTAFEEAVLSLANYPGAGIDITLPQAAE